MGVPLWLCWMFASFTPLQDVRVLAPGESANRPLPGIETQSDAVDSAPTRMYPITIEIGTRPIGTRPRAPNGRGGEGMLPDLLVVVSVCLKQAIFIDPSFDTRKLGAPIRQTIADEAEIFPFVSLESGRRGAYLVRGSCFWLARERVAGSSRDTVFVAPADLQSMSDEEPAYVLLQTSDVSSNALRESLAFAASKDARIVATPGNQFVAVSGKASDVRIVNTAIEQGLALAITPATARGLDLFSQPDSSHRRLAFQFDGVRGSPLVDFVESCRGHGISIELDPKVAASRSIRIHGKVVIPTEDLGKLVEDVARGLDLVVTGDGARRRYWEPAEFAAARAAVDESARASFESILVAADALDPWRRRATRIRVALPLVAFDFAAANALLAPLLLDPVRDGEAYSGVGSIFVVGPADAVVRSADLLVAAMNATKPPNPLQVKDGTIAQDSPAASLGRLTAHLKAHASTQPVFLDASLDGLLFDVTASNPTNDPREAISLVDRTLAKHNAYMVRLGCMFRAIRPSSPLMQTLDRVFVTPAQLANSESARPVALLLAPRSGDSTPWVDRFRSAISKLPNARVSALTETNLILLLGAERDLGFVAAGVDTGELVAAAPRPPLSLEPFEKPSGSGSQLRIQFDEIEGTPLHHFVEYCAVNGFAVELHPPSLGDLPIRVSGSLEIAPENVHRLVHDIARALGLHVTEIGGKLALWSKAEIFKKRIMSAGSNRSDPRAPSPIHLTIEPKDLDSRRESATLVRVELPLGALPLEAAHTLLAPLLFDPMFQYARSTAEGTLVLSAPAFTAARCSEILDAAQALVSK